MSFINLPITSILALLQYAPQIKGIIDSAVNATSLQDGVHKVAPIIVPILEKVASTLFPQLAPEFHVAAAAMATFDPNKTKWLQQSLNALIPELNLVVDGIYGPATVRGVTAAQEKLGLKSDGWAGMITNTAIQAALNLFFGAPGGSKVPALPTVAKVEEVTGAKVAAAGAPQVALPVAAAASASFPQKPSRGAAT